MAIIRPLGKGDIAPLLTLIRGDDVANHWGQDDFSDASDGNNKICYYFENTGFVLIQKVLDEAEILMIWISPMLRGQGLGAKLLDHAKANLKAAAIKTLFLEVAKDNQSALKLYKNAGFIEIGRRKDYYKTANNTHIDAIVMNLNL